MAETPSGREVAESFVNRNLDQPFRRRLPSLPVPGTAATIRGAGRAAPTPAMCGSADSRGPRSGSIRRDEHPRLAADLKAAVTEFSRHRKHESTRILPSPVHKRAIVG